MVNLLWLSPENGLYSWSSCCFWFLFYCLGFFFFNGFFVRFFFFFLTMLVGSLFPNQGWTHAPRSKSAESPTTGPPRNSCLLKKSLFMYLSTQSSFLAVLGLCCCTRAFSSCGAQASHFGGLSGFGALAQ